MLSVLFVCSAESDKKPSPAGEGFFYTLKIHLFFLTSAAFVDKNAKYGIPLLRYTVFLQNCPLENDPKSVLFVF